MCYSKCHKVEGAKTNTPPKINTYKRLPIANTLWPWTIPRGVGVQAHIVMVLGAISGATS